MSSKAGPMRTCSDCPSFISPDDRDHQVELFGKELTVPMCGRFTEPLGTHNSTNQQNDQIQYDRAANCPDYGLRWDGKPEPDVPRAKFADPTEDTTPLTTPLQGARAHACSGCEKYIDPEKMMNSFGIPFPGCYAWSEIIPVHMGRQYARDCQYNQLGFQQDNDLSALQLRPYLGANLTFIDTDGTIRMAERADVDPADYPTDREVSADDDASGIRAWRRIVNPDGSGTVIYLPVFKPEIFTPEEMSKIPRPGDEEHPELYRDHQGLAYKMGVLWMHLNETPALNGIAGVGKTEAFRYLAFLMQLPFERISITGSTELDDLAGRWVLEPDAETGTNVTRFHYGRLPKSWSKPCVVCLDEPNAGPSDVWQFIRPLTDNSKQMVIDMNKGERIDRHRFCYLGMAMNPSWDIRNVGTHQIADADGSRLMHIAVPSPSEDLEKEILIRRCLVDGYELPTDKLLAIMAIAKELRDMMTNGDTLSISWGTRQTIKVARASQWFNLKEAHRLAAADLVEPQEADRILAVVDSHTSDGVSYQKAKPQKSSWTS